MLLSASGLQNTIAAWQCESVHRIVWFEGVLAFGLQSACSLLFGESRMDLLPLANPPLQNCAVCILAPLTETPRLFDDCMDLYQCGATRFAALVVRRPEGLTLACYPL